MTTIREIDLGFSFSGASDIIHFDCDKYHAGSTISHVDIIVEYDNCYLFIEVKDSDIPGAKNLNSFVEKNAIWKIWCRALSTNLGIPFFSVSAG